MQKLAPFNSAVFGSRRVTVRGSAHQLQNERTPRHNARATGEEVATYERLENRRFAAALAADDDNLWQLRGLRLTTTHNQNVLQFVQDLQQRRLLYRLRSPFLSFHLFVC